MKRIWLAGLASFALAACSDDNVERFDGVVTYDDFPATAAGADHSDDLGFTNAFVLSAGFANGQAVQYLDLGEFNPAPAKMYIIVHDGAPLAGQFPIVDTLPDDAEYSPFWQVVEVTVGEGYKANDIKSLKGLKDRGFKMADKLEAIHCPIVNPDAAWVAADFSQTYTVFWGTGEEIPNPNFDPSADISDTNKPTLNDSDATANDILLTPIWQKHMRAFCWSDDLAKRYPLVEEDGVATLDSSSFTQQRFDTYNVGFTAGGEVDASPSDLLPVFSDNVGDAGYSPAALQYFVSSPGSQPGSVGDFDADEVASTVAGDPSDLLDNPIVFPLALDRFTVTIANTSAPGPDAHTLGAGYAVVEDGSAPLWLEGEAAPGAVAAYVASGDINPIAIGWPVSGRPLSPILDAMRVPAVAPGETASLVVLASPYVGLLSTIQTLEGVDDTFTGLSEASLYDEDGAAIDTQTLDLMAYITNAEIENPDDPTTPLEVVGLSPDLEDAVGTATISLINPAAPAAGGNP